MRMRSRARWRLFRRQLRPELIVGVVVLIVLVIASHRRNEVWRQPVKLWADAAAKSPMKARPLLNAGREYDALGQHDVAARYFLAAAQLPAVTSTDRKMRSVALTDLGYLALMRGDNEPAFGYIQGAMASAPTLEAMNVAALYDLVMGQPRRAIQLTDDILEQGPKEGWRMRSSIWATRGQAFQAIGDCNNAMASYAALKYLKPDFQIPACP
jgi:tetratricopeptide (TPR) repeat protein